MGHPALAAYDGEILSHDRIEPDRSLMRADAVYTMREAAAFTRLKSAELRELLDRIDIKPFKLKGRELVKGTDVLRALEAV
jgi:hypothetical protein